MPFVFQASYAPVGKETSAIRSLLTDSENGQLNPLGINWLRSFPAIGYVVWGARTLRGVDQLADEYKYIPVRRLSLFIEESLYRGTPPDRAAIAPGTSGGRESHQDCRTAMKDAVTPAGPPSCGLARRTDPTSD